MTRRGAFKAAATALCATGLLAACETIGPEEALAPAAIPAEWTALSGALAPAGSKPVTEDWLSELSDPAVTPVVAEALAYNNDLAAAGARVRAVLAQARIQRAALLPQVGGSLGAQRERSLGTGGIVGDRFVPGGDYVNTFSSGLNAQWELDVWGRLTDLTRSAYLDLDAQRLDYAAASLSLAGGAAQSLYALTEARLQRELAERDVEAGLANLNIIERRYERGVSSSLDVRLARASLAQSRAQLIAREQAERETARSLEVLLGRYPAALVEAADALPELAALVTEDGGLIGLGGPEDLLFRRPDILSAEARLASAGLQVSAARKALLPSLSVSAGVRGLTQDRAIRDEAGNRIGSIEADSGSLFDLNALAKSIGGQLFQPIFQGGRLRAQVEAQRAQREAAVYQYAQAVLDAFREVENGVAAEAFLSAQLEARRLAFEEAEAAEELTERRYLNGTTNIFDLISAQQRRILNESQFIAASRARLTNRIDLYLALGAPFVVPAELGPGPDGLPNHEGRPAGGPRYTPVARDGEIARRAAEERRL